VDCTGGRPGRIALVVVQENAANDAGMIRKGVNFKVSAISPQFLESTSNFKSFRLSLES